MLITQRAAVTRLGVDVIVEFSLQKNSTAHGITASYGKFLREALT